MTSVQFVLRVSHFVAKRCRVTCIVRIWGDICLRKEKESRWHLLKARFLKLSSTLRKRRNQDPPSPTSSWAEAQGLGLCLARGEPGTAPDLWDSGWCTFHSPELPQAASRSLEICSGAFWSPYQKDLKSCGFCVGLNMTLWSWVSYLTFLNWVSSSFKWR